MDLIRKGMRVTAKTQSIHFFGFSNNIHFVIGFKHDPYDKLSIGSGVPLPRDLLSVPKELPLVPSRFMPHVPLMKFMSNEDNKCYLISAMLFTLFLYKDMSKSVVFHMETDENKRALRQFISQLSPAIQKRLQENKEFWASCSLLRLVEGSLLSLQSGINGEPGSDKNDTIPWILFAELEKKLGEVPSLNVDRIEPGRQDDPFNFIRRLFNAKFYYLKILRELPNYPFNKVDPVDLCRVWRYTHAECTYCNQSQMSHPPIADCGLRIDFANDPGKMVNVLNHLQSTEDIPQRHARCPNVHCETNNPKKKKFGLSAAELVKSNQLGNAVLVFLNRLETSCFSSGKTKKNRFSEKKYDCDPFRHNGKEYIPRVFIVGDITVGKKSNYTAGHYELVYVLPGPCFFRSFNFPCRGRAGTFPITECTTYEQLTERIGKNVLMAYY